MAQGIALNDQQRLPWLMNLHDLLKNWESQDKNGILACSALKAKYRQLLNCGTESENTIGDLKLNFILLNLSYDLASQRLKKRSHEFINGTSILESQFSILEIDSNDKSAAFKYQISLTDDKSIDDCVYELKLLVDNLQ
jgi:gluconokinase